MKGDCNQTTLDPLSEKNFIEIITLFWIRSFMDGYIIVSRAQTGKPMVSPEKRIFIEEDVALRLEQISRDFNSGAFDKDILENFDETHFVVNMDDGQTLGFIGNDNVKYANMVSGGENMTMVVRLSGGRNAMIQTPFMIFQNYNRNYKIRGVPDNVPGAFYRTLCRYAIPPQECNLHGVTRCVHN